MNRRIFIAMIVPIVALASVITVLTGERQAVSLQIWLACFVVGFAISAVLRLRDHAPFAPIHRLAFWRRSPAPTEPAVSRDRRLRSLEGLVLRSRDNSRAFTQQLQPQLIELATHHLRVTHGVDLERDATRPVAALGDLSWLIEPSTDDRTPTIDELERFMHVLVSPSSGGTT